MADMTNPSQSGIQTDDQFDPGAKNRGAMGSGAGAGGGAAEDFDSDAQAGSGSADMPHAEKRPDSGADAPSHGSR